MGKRAGQHGKKDVLAAERTRFQEKREENRWIITKKLCWRTARRFRRLMREPELVRGENVVTEQRHRRGKSNVDTIPTKKKTHY